MATFSGFLLDQYAHPIKGVVLWLLCDDGIRRSFHQDFETTFFLRGPLARLREAAKFLEPKPVRLEWVTRTDLYDGPQDVLQVSVTRVMHHSRIWRDVKNRFPDLILYDVDTTLQLRYAAAFDVFPMARCKVQVKKGEVIKIKAIDSRWDVDPLQPPLRTLDIEPDIDPEFATPKNLRVSYWNCKIRISLEKPREALVKLNRILYEFNPDIILTRFGDTWLFKYLEELAEQTHTPFNPNRDASRNVIRKPAVSYFTYGKAKYRHEQIHLLGRIHIDLMNSAAFDEIDLAGVLENARITCQPVQEAARRSAGSGISAMQVVTAMRWGVMVPYQRQKAEVPKTFRQLLEDDGGGFIGKPKAGVRKNVAVLDFMMMYPSLMDLLNLSPETVGVNDPDSVFVSELGVYVACKRGLIPETLKPMIKKRIAIKDKIEPLSPESPIYDRYKAMSDAMKELGIVSNGRMSFANAIFGRLNTHEAIAKAGIDKVLQAKAVSENLDFSVWHIYIDSLFVSREGATGRKDFKPLMDEIERTTSLRIGFEGVFSWFIFVGSRPNPKKSVSNRFFGRLYTGEFKVRGLALRRSDTCAYVASVQREMLNILGREADADRLIYLLPEIVQTTRERCADLRTGNISPDKLIMMGTLSREVKDAKVKTVIIRAVKQLHDAGKVLNVGQPVRYIHTRGAPGCYPLGLPTALDVSTVNFARYKEFVVRAVFEVIQSLGVPEDLFRSWIKGASYISVEDWILPANRRWITTAPLFATTKSPLLLP
jgi:DNA polymerase-2